jgi:hypothetical protein
MAKKARLTPHTRGLARAAHDILRFLDQHHVPACLIGGLAVQRWGEPRVTQDVDLTLLAPFGDERRPVDLLLGRYRARDRGAKRFALEYRVLKLTTQDGVPIDVSLGALPFEMEVLDRALRWPLTPTINVPVCSAEDLVIYKLIAARPRDLLDVEGVVRVQGRRLDIARVRFWMRTLSELLEMPDLIEPFEDALRKARRRPQP